MPEFQSFKSFQSFQSTPRVQGGPQKKDTKKPQQQTALKGEIADAPGAWLSDLQFLRWLEKSAPETMRTWREYYARSVGSG